MVECELEQEDDWVVVKKQKITILVSPPSPLHPQSMSSEKNKTQPKIVKRSSGVRKKRERELTKDKHEEPSATPAPANDSLAVGIGISSRDQEPICNPVDFPEQFRQPSLIKDNGNGRVVAVHRKSVNVPRAPPIGALNVVNRRMRAWNLDRKLEGMGGLRSWLVSQKLERFVKVGKYELVNLTMSMLKDMGTDAVGPRRKLIHAIDCLSQPYYFKTPR